MSRFRSAVCLGCERRSKSAAGAGPKARHSGPSVPPAVGGVNTISQFFSWFLVRVRR